MPRPLRTEFPGAIYHVMNRGDRCEPILDDDVELAARRKGDSDKVALAHRLRAETP